VSANSIPVNRGMQLIQKDRVHADERSRRAVEFIC